MGEEYENIILVNDAISDPSEDEVSMDESPMLSINVASKQFELVDDP